MRSPPARRIVSASAGLVLAGCAGVGGVDDASEDAGNGAVAIMAQLSPSSAAGSSGTGRSTAEVDLTPMARVDESYVPVCRLELVVGSRIPRQVCQAPMNEADASQREEILRTEIEIAREMQAIEEQMRFEREMREAEERRRMQEMP